MTTKNIFQFIVISLAFCLFQPIFAQDDVQKFQRDSIYISEQVTKARQLLYPKPDSAEIITLQVIEYAEKEDSEFGFMKSYMTLGIIKFVKQDLENCKKYLDMALILAKKRKDEKAKSSIINNLGNYYLKKNNLDKALEYYLISLEIDKQQKEAELAPSYVNIGIIQQRLKNYEEAENYFRKAIATPSKNSETNRLYAYMNIAELNQQIQKHQKNILLADSIYRLARQLGINNAIGASYNYRAAAFSRRNNYEEVLENLDSALVYFPKENPYHYTILLEKGRILIEISKYKEAEQAVLDALPHLENLWKEKSTALIYLSRIHKGTKQFDKSLEYLEKYNVAADTLKNQEQRREVANLLVKYDTKEKEAAIEKLGQEAKIKDLELKNSYYVIAGSVVLGLVILIAVWIFFRQKNIIDTFEKEQAKLRWRRAQINPHFFFNVLSAIQMLVYEKETERVSKYITGFSYLMRQVLEGSNQEKISLEEEIKFLNTYLSLEKLSLDFDYKIIEEAQDGSDELEIEDIFIPTMLLQPFVENAIEHGLRKSTKSEKNVEIKFTEISQNLLQISIKDNGAGRNQERKKQHISRALEITKDRQKLMKNAFEYEIIDHKDEKQNALGTEAVFSIKI